MRKPRAKTLSGNLALTALAVASISVLFFIGLLVYGQSVGGFRFYDPQLRRAFRIGLLISLTAVYLSLGGVWRPISLRWLAPVTATGTLILWVSAAASE